MPLPSRKEKEDKSSFMSRCMSDNTMKEEYANIDQRTAICLSKAVEFCDKIEAADFEYTIQNFGYEEELTAENFYTPLEAEYEDFGEELEEWDIAAEKPGLWENIRKKKEREGKNYKPAKPGDPDRPDPKSFKKAQSDDGEMAVSQIKKMRDQLIEIVSKLEVTTLPIEFEEWTKDMVSKAEIYIQNVYDFVKYYEPEEVSDTETEDEAEAKFGYQNPKTGELYFYRRPGRYEKDGTTLVYLGEASEYQGRKVTLNKPFRTSNGPKKFAVYVKNESGNVVIVRFGDPSLSIKKHIPERRKSFRARHNCDNPGPKWKARYWACRSW
jgi:hypothetical protein